MSKEKDRSHATYQKCLERVRDGGKAPELKSKYQMWFGAKKLMMEIPKDKKLW